MTILVLIQSNKNLLEKFTFGKHCLVCIDIRPIFMKNYDFNLHILIYFNIFLFVDTRYRSKYIGRYRLKNVAELFSDIACIVLENLYF